MLHFQEVKTSQHAAIVKTALAHINSSLVLRLYETRVLTYLFQWVKHCKAASNGNFRNLP